MKFLAIIPLLCLFSPGVVQCDEIKTDEGVLVLTKGNYESAIKDNEFVLVEFYAPWCGHCKALAPEYVKAAKKLEEQNSAIKLGKVDATEEGELAEENAADEIVNWLLKKTGPAATTLASADELKKLVDDNEVVVVGFFSDADNEAAKQYLAAAGGIDDYPFGIVTDSALAGENKVSGDAVVVFKKFDDGRSDLTEDLTEENIVKFIKAEALPLIVDFNHETAQKVFGGEIRSHVLLFLSKEAGHYDKYLENHRSVAKQYRNQLLYVSINTDDEDHGRILEFFGMKKEEIPAARLIKLADEMAKYKPTGDVLENTDEMTAFIDDFVAGKLKQHLLSQDVPEDWDKTPVKILVASNFDDVALNKEKDVLVEFYAPWCGHCKQLAPIFDKLGEKFKDHPTIVIAKMDATVNELEHTKINSFPTLKLYKKGDNKIVEYNGERTLEGLAKFLETDGSYGQAAPDQVVDYTGGRTLEEMSDFLEQKQGEEEDEDDDAPKKDEL
ncbi:Protein disulfide-isomerase [Orchesella cincta]|uniref:protein disulfide-isomerase n=1 Tax=Orchesella cincta TaxID=48709 RepID=A0A1D2MT70_ORCCI|nr:Protein disulfide-isomerase [Orchesella cincta]